MTARFTISLPDEDLVRIDAFAEERGVTRSELVREATGRYIAQTGGEEAASRRRSAGERLLADLAVLRTTPSADERDTLDILREMRGPLDARSGGHGTDAS
jgi:predicted transcriptional regulator